MRRIEIAEDEAIEVGDMFYVGKDWKAYRALSFPDFVIYSGWIRFQFKKLFRSLKK